MTKVSLKCLSFLTASNFGKILMINLYLNRDSRLLIQAYFGTTTEDEIMKRITEKRENINENKKKQRLQMLLPTPKRFSR